jgi:glycosyltransferase involved in cell wall biosynthesis
MRILFCSPNAKSKSFGAPKVLVELSEELELFGWNVNFITSDDLSKETYDNLTPKQSQKIYSENLRDYLKKHAANYDVVDYDHGHLPYSRIEFAANTLMVARSVLLAHHFKPDLKKIPSKPTRNWKCELKFFLKQSLQINKLEETQAERRIKIAHHTCLEADLVNVANEDDKLELIKSGIPETKICVIPYGISRFHRPLFEQISSDLPSEHKVAFVGTFDYRKGASDFPRIVENICQFIPNVTFRLIGTNGLFTSKNEVLNFFSEKTRNHIEVIPRFEPNDLPRFLSDCSLGIFPSYIEGFGFGVLEMLAASVPVIAYNSPGPPMMLPKEYLVEPGDTDKMVEKVVDLLNDSVKLSSARIWAKERSQQFCWEKIAKETSQVYMEHWQKKQSIIPNETL